MLGALSLFAATSVAAQSTVSLSASPNPVSEGSSVRVTATLSSALASNVSIGVRSTNGTAEDDDYNKISSITIAAGETTGSRTIFTLDDCDPYDETFTVELLSVQSSGVTAGSPSSVTVTISDGDPSTPDLCDLRVHASTSASGAFTAVGLTPLFSPGTTSYTATVANDKTHVKLTPTVADNESTVTVAGTTVSSGAASGAIALSVGANAITVQVTAQDETMKDYTVTITRQSSNANLSALTASSATSSGGTYSSLTLAPSFSAGTTSYTATVADARTHAKLTPTVADTGKATVTVAGTVVTSGSASAAIALSVGANAITVRVTAQDGTTRDYTVTITRQAVQSSNANLSALTASTSTSSAGTFTALTLTPSTFAATTTSYTATVANARTHVKLTPTVADNESTVTVAGTTVSSGAASGAIALSVGANAITVQVTAQDETMKDYTVTITRQSSNANLSALTASSATSSGGTYSSLTLAPSFSAGTTSYTATVADARTHAKLTPTVADTGKATVTVAGTTVSSGAASAAIALSVGANAITVRVTAQDGTTRDYTVTITRQAVQSSNANLSALTASSATSSGGAYSSLTLTPSFSAGTTSYTATVANARTHAKLTPTVADTGKATVTVAGTAVTSGSTSAAIALSVGANAITVRVTAQNGTTRDYTVTITRQTPPPTVSLSASPTQVTEGSSVTVTATLSSALSSAVTIPVTVSTASPNTAEPGDVGTLTGITVGANSTTGTGTITTNQDGDRDDETFTVALGSNLPAGVTAGSPSSVRIRISDDDKALELSVDAHPACGTRITGTSVTTTTINLRLTPPPAVETATQYRWLTGTAQGKWTGSPPIRTHGRSGGVNYSALADLRRAFPGFAGFEYRLHYDPGVTAQCTWQFNDGGGAGGDPRPDGDPPPDDGDDGDGSPTGGPPGGDPPGGGGGPPPAPQDEDDDDGDDDGDGGPPSAAIETDAVCEAGLCRARTGAAVAFRDASTGSVSTRLWDFDDGAQSRSAAPTRSWASPGFYEVTLSVSDGTVESKASLTFLVEAAEPAGTCAADAETRCLRHSRFAVEMEWWTGEDRGGPGKVVPEGTNDSALFHFFEPGDNWEVLIKVLDGCSVNEHVWVYGASATTLGYAIRVTDTVTGVVREYVNEDGRRADAIADSEAFAGVCADR